MGMLRIEKGYRSWVAEITSEVTPHAAGLERFCSKTKDYIGRPVVEAERVTPPKKRFVTLAVDNTSPPCWGTEPVLKRGELIGYITSGGMGWRTGKMLAVGWINGDSVHNGDELGIQILMKYYKAVVVADPVYDPKNDILLG